MHSSKIVRNYDYHGTKIVIKHNRIMSESDAALYGSVDPQLKDGFLCGYVTIEKTSGNGILANYLEDYGHPDIDVHGGVTFFEEQGDNVTYGFDCAHWNDNIAHCDVDYVSKECESLAKQLRELTGVIE